MGLRGISAIFTLLIILAFIALFVSTNYDLYKNFNTETTSLKVEAVAGVLLPVFSLVGVLYLYAA